MLGGGAGVGLVIPTLANAVAASLPPARFATGSAVYGMSRQFGVALGIAILIAVLGNPGPGQVLASFRSGWEVMLGCALATAVTAMTIGRLPRVPEVDIAVDDLDPLPVVAKAVPAAADRSADAA